MIHVVMNALGKFRHKERHWEEKIIRDGRMDCIASSVVRVPDPSLALAACTHDMSLAGRPVPIS